MCPTSLQLVLYDMEVFQKFLVLYGAKQQVPVAMVMDADGISSSKDPILLVSGVSGSLVLTSVEYIRSFV